MSPTEYETAKAKWLSDMKREGDLADEESSFNLHGELCEFENENNIPQEQRAYSMLNIKIPDEVKIVAEWLEQDIPTLYKDFSIFEQVQMINDALIVVRSDLEKGQG